MTIPALPFSSSSLGLTPPATANAAPLVTVLMAVYNAAPYVREAIDSILQQSFTDFEFLIYNDGSTDDSAAIVRSYTDARIIFIDQLINRGVSRNMNEGIERTRGRYIVRMDADDVAYPERIAQQVAFLEAHPAVGLCGSAIRYIGASEGIIYPPQDNDTIQNTLWLQNTFFQPSVIIRTSVLLEHNLRYNDNYEAAEDYKLWSDMSVVTKLHNLSEVLLDYRIHPHQISRRQSTKQHKSSALIRQEQMSRLRIFLKPEHRHAFELLTIGDNWQKLQLTDYAEVAALLEDLGAQTRQSSNNPKAVYKVLGGQWGEVLQAAKYYHPGLVPFILRLPLRRYLPRVVVLKLLTKCLLFWRVRAPD